MATAIQARLRWDLYGGTTRPPCPGTKCAWCWCRPHASDYKPYHYFAKLEFGEKTGGVFRFQNPILAFGVLDFRPTDEKMVFPFFCKILGLSLPHHFFGPIQIFHRRNLDAQKPDKNRFWENRRKTQTPSKNPMTLSSFANSDNNESRTLHSLPGSVKP